jgi:cytoskeletal protein CcmA (bactofilin family)
MMMSFVPVVLAGATAAMVALPLTPALREFRRREDAAPLPTRTDDGHIENFAKAFAARLKDAALEPVIAECRAAQSTRLVRLPDGTRALILPDAAAIGELRVLARRNQVTALIFCSESVTLPDGAQVPTDVSCEALQSGAGCSFRAIHALGAIALGEANTIFRWIYTPTSLSVDSGSQLYGRASAGEVIALAADCRFERVHAPVVLIGCEELPGELQRPAVYAGRSIMDIKLGRVLAGGDFRLDCGDVLQGHVIVAGSVWLGAGSRVLGSVKSRHDAHIGRGTEIQGALVSSGSLTIAGSSHIRGPVIAESELVIGPGTQIGSPETPTTVSAPSIRIAAGSVVYGTLWARAEGVTEEG